MDVVRSKGCRTSASPEYCDKKETELKILLGMFPLEVWSMVLNRLKDDEILASLSNSSLFFRYHFWTKRTEFLFPRVVKLLQKTLVPGDWDWDADAKPLLNCRLVCKKWNNAIEQLCADECCSNDHFLTASLSTSYPFSIEEFLNHFRNTHPDTNVDGKCPLLGRSANLNLSDEDQRDDVLACLKIYGCHIWDCALWYVRSEQPFNNEPSVEEMYALFCSWLKLMPNLRKLDISQVFPDSFDKTALEKFVNNTPLWQFAYLHTLVLSDVPEPITDSIIAKNPQIETLIIRDIADPIAINPDNLVVLNLKTLYLLMHREVEYHVLEAIAAGGGSPMLTNVSINTYDVYISWFRALVLLSKTWQSSLEKLELKSLSTPKWFEGIRLNDMQNILNSNELNFDKLKHVRLRIENGVIPLDFLLSSKRSLESLIINIYYDLTSTNHVKQMDAIVKSQKIDLIQNFLSMPRSNVWSFFPQLRSIRYSMNCKNLTDCEDSALPYWLILGHRVMSCTRISGVIANTEIEFQKK